MILGRRDRENLIMANSFAEMEKIFARAAAARLRREHHKKAADLLVKLAKDQPVVRNQVDPAF